MSDQIIISNNDAPLRQRRGAMRKWVRWAKWILPLTALALLLVALLWPLIRILPQNIISSELSEFISDGVAEFRVDKARLMTSDQKGQGYNLTADELRQSADNEDLINLAAPKADLRMANDEWLFLSADQGRYDMGKQLLQLKGAVNLFQDQGYEIEIKSVDVNFGKQSLSSKDDVEGRGPSGIFHGEGIDIEDEGALLRLKGNSEVIIYDNQPAP